MAGVSGSGGALHVRSVTKRFQTPEGGEVVALDDVSLEIEQGEFFVLLGPSGCGKTTLLRVIAGLEYPDVGEVWVGDERIDLQPTYQRRVNTVFQSYALFPHMTVAQNVAFGLEMDGQSYKQALPRVREMLDLVRLGGYENRRPAQLSGGQAQRVALARALAKAPEVLLLDEPLSALDRKLRRGMQIELKRIQQLTGVTFVFVTHDQEEAMSMGDRIAVFSHGRIAQLGTPRAIYEHPVDTYVADFIGETNLVSSTVEGVGAEAGYRLPGGGLLRHSSLDPILGPPPPAGSPATLAIRPEHLRPGEADAVLTGVVTSVVYVGSDLRVTVDVAGTDVVMRMPARGIAAPEEGAALALAVVPGAARTVSDPVVSELPPEAA